MRAVVVTCRQTQRGGGGERGKDRRAVDVRHLEGWNCCNDGWGCFKSDRWTLQLRHLTFNSHSKEERREGSRDKIKLRKTRTHRKDTWSNEEGKIGNKYEYSTQILNVCVLCGMVDCRSADRQYNVTIHSDSLLNTMDTKREEPSGKISLHIHKKTTDQKPFLEAYPRSCLKCLLMCRSVARLTGQLSWASNRQKAAEANERFKGKCKLEIVCRHKHWAGTHDVILFGKIIDSEHGELQRVWFPSWPPAQACFW